MKHRLRLNMRDKLSTLSPNDMALRSVLLNKNLMALIERAHIPRGTVIGVCFPLAGEPDLNFSELTNLGLELAFPLIENNEQMSFHLCGPNKLVARQVGSIVLHSPPLGCQLAKPIYLIIPGLAFNRFGYRLGRGKGYFDRFLEKTDGKKVKAIGIGFAEQVIEEAFSDSHDVPMNWIVTDKEIISLDH